MVTMTGARYLAETLEAYGVSHVFFVPTILSFALAEMEQRTQIQRVVTHGEKAAVYMADGYARALGRPGVCMAQTAGAANLVAGLRDPYLASTPLIALTGGPTPESRGRHMYQEIDDLPLFKSVTKASRLVDRVDRLPDALRQAFRDATTGTPGPVHIEIQGHQGQLEQDEADLDPVVDERFAHCPPFRPEPDAASVAEAARLLEGADRPVLIIGGGARTSGADLEVLELAERLAIPFATSLNGKSVVPGDHPLNVGVVGNYSRESANRTVLAAGLVFFVGSRTGSQATASWQVPRPGTRVIQLDINPNELGRHYPNQVEIAGDAKVSVQHLLAVADSSSADRRGEWVQCAQGFVAEWRDRYHSLITSEATPIRPERICGELTGHLPPDAILVADTGHAGMWTGGMVDLIHSGQDYLRAAGSLGWGLPAAIGAKMAQPDRPVLLFTGDGGLYYHLAELETAARWGVNVVILVNDNGSLNQEIHPYSESYGGQLHGRHEELWHFRAIDLAAVAESLGVTGIRVERPGDLRPALERAFSADGPVLLDVVTDIEALAPLALTSP